MPKEHIIKRSPITGIRWLLTALCLGLFLLALVTPVNHDESQYLAASYLLPDRLPFVDFLYLQPPYQPLLTWPILHLAQGYSFVAARMLTATLGCCILIAVFATQRRLGVRDAYAALTVTLLWLCHSFGFSVTVFRNDALPALFLAGALIVASIDLTSRQPFGALRWASVGLLLGGAFGTKLSYAFSAAAGAGFPVLIAMTDSQNRRRALLAGAWAAAGLVAALIPVAVMRGLAPEVFDYGVFQYHREAPFAWYTMNGYVDRLTLASKAVDVVLILARGPALAALAIVCFFRLKEFRAGQRRDSMTLLLELMCVAGLVATCLPTPTWRQYAMPLLPPLFVLLGMEMERHVSIFWSSPLSFRLALAVGALVGIAQPVFNLVKGTGAPIETPVSATREAHWIGRMASGHGPSGTIATLSPEVVLDSGFALDPVFATGPFAYRTGDIVPASRQAVLHMVSPATLGRHFNASPPVAIVTGYESFDHLDRTGLDTGLRGYAKTHRYRLHRSPYGDAELWLAPHETAVRR